MRLRLGIDDRRPEEPGAVRECRGCSSTTPRVRLVDSIKREFRANEGDFARCPSSGSG